MSMIKVISPSSQDFSEPATRMIKVSSRGIIGNDRADLIKRAGAELVEKIADIKFEKDEIPVHMIAIGSTEDYGPNRNGDGFKRACCEKYHDTFTKFARFYRDHANKNPAKSYGLVKASAYNKPMKRIELIAALNGSKEAAERNGGLLADKELEKLARDEDMGVSMACTIGYDVCSACGNKARTRAEYCDSPENGGHCKAGGLRHNIGRVLEDGHILHADNPHPRFFDISHVFRPADRIAYVSGQLKAASAGLVSGAELAEQLGLTLPAHAMDKTGSVNLQAQLYALEKLAEAEAQQLAQPSQWQQVALAAHENVQPPVDFTPCTHVKLSEVLKALTDSSVILPPRDFLQLTTKKANSETVTAVCAALPGVFNKLAAELDICTQLENNVYLPARAASAATRTWAEKIAATHSIKTKEVEKRAFLAALHQVQPLAQLVNEKQANTNQAAVALARHYAFYKIAAFAKICEQYGENGLTASHCVLQNYIS